LFEQLSAPLFIFKPGRSGLRCPLLQHGLRSLLPSKHTVCTSVASVMAHGGSRYEDSPQQPDFRMKYQACGTFQIKWTAHPNSPRASEVPCIPLRTPPSLGRIQGGSRGQASSGDGCNRLNYHRRQRSKTWGETKHCTCPDAARVLQCLAFTYLSKIREWSTDPSPSAHPLYLAAQQDMSENTRRINKGTASSIKCGPRQS
jgi:hypothetical protein